MLLSELSNSSSFFIMNCDLISWSLTFCERSGLSLVTLYEIHLSLIDRILNA